MSKNLVYESFEKLEEFMVKSFEKAGLSEEDSKIIAEVLIESDKRGIDSHGVGRFKPIYLDRIEEGIINTKTKIDVVRDHKAIAVIDGNHSMGHVVSYKAMSMAIEKAKEHGLGMVVVRNSTHYGIAGYYATMASKENMIGITGTNARSSIAPTFGVEPKLGTNPLTFGMPTDEDFPFVLDCATSIAQRGKVEHYARIDKEMPVGWVVGADGKPVTDPHAALVGFSKGTAALAPLGGLGEELGGYKGYGYATVVEILSAALQGGSYLSALNGVAEDGSPQPHKLGHFFIAIDIEAFIDPEEFKKITGGILRELREATKAEGAERIYTAGEKEYLAFLERSKNGVPINEEVRKTFDVAREKLGVDFKFSWEN